MSSIDNFITNSINLSDCTIRLSAGGFGYSGEPIEPEVYVYKGEEALILNTDYTVAYKDNINRGIGSVIVTGKGKYSGKVIKNFEIMPIMIPNWTVTLEGSQFKYTGNEIKPKIIVKEGMRTCILDVDYTLQYNNNINPGVGSIAINGKGNYMGRIIKTFDIIFNLESPEINIEEESNGIKLNWNTVENASGYEVYRSVQDSNHFVYLSSVNDINYIDTKTDRGITYYYKVRAYSTINGTQINGDFSSVVSKTYTLGAPTITVGIENNGIKIGWNKVSNAVGYTIYRSTQNDSNFTYLTSVSGTSYIDTTAQAGTTYYYKVRAFNKVNGTQINGDFSVIKFVQI